MKLAGLVAVGVLFTTAIHAADNFTGEILDFSAEWCQPCQQMSPIVARLKRSGMPIRKVDIEKYPSLTRGYRVQSIPTFVLVVNGKEVDRIVGATSEARLKGLLARIPQQASPASSNPNANADRSQPLIAKVNNLIRKRTPVTEESAAVIRAQSDDQQLKPNANKRLASTVRLRIRDGQGTSFGTGTVISSKPGRSVVVTCGHVFRGWTKASRLEVDVFAADGRTETFVGEPIDYDIKAEVGLLSINTAGVLPTARVASLEGMVQPKNRVFSVGCGHGELPTVEFHEVTGIDRYQGFDNIECTGAPIQGRSGGGLFNGQGEVIGTCIGFMNVGGNTKRGLYSGLRAIHRILDRQSLTHLYRGVEPKDFDHQIAQPDDAGGRPEANRSHATATPPTRDEQLSAAAFEPVAAVETAESELRVAGGRGRVVTETADASPKMQAAIAAALNSAADAEVVCVIRSRTGSEPSRVVIIDRATKGFVRFLDGEIRNQTVQTTKRIPRTAANTITSTPRLSSSTSHNLPSAVVAAIHTPTKPAKPTPQRPHAPRRYVRSRVQKSTSN